MGAGCNRTVCLALIFAAVLHAAIPKPIDAPSETEETFNEMPEEGTTLLTPVPTEALSSAEKSISVQNETIEVTTTPPETARLPVGTDVIHSTLSPETAVVSESEIDPLASVTVEPTQNKMLEHQTEIPAVTIDSATVAIDATPIKTDPTVVATKSSPATDVTLDSTQGITEATLNNDDSKRDHFPAGDTTIVPSVVAEASLLTTEAAVTVTEVENLERTNPEATGSVPSGSSDVTSVYNLTPTEGDAGPTPSTEDASEAGNNTEQTAVAEDKIAVTAPAPPVPTGGLQLKATVMPETPLDKEEVSTDIAEIESAATQVPGVEDSHAFTEVASGLTSYDGATTVLPDEETSASVLDVTSSPSLLDRPGSRHHSRGRAFDNVSVPPTLGSGPIISIEFPTTQSANQEAAPTESSVPQETTFQTQSPESVVWGAQSPVTPPQITNTQTTIFESTELPTIGQTSVSSTPLQQSPHVAEEPTVSPVELVTQAADDLVTIQPLGLPESKTTAREERPSSITPNSEEKYTEPTTQLTFEKNSDEEGENASIVTEKEHTAEEKSAQGTNHTTKYEEETVEHSAEEKVNTTYDEEIKSESPGDGAKTRGAEGNKVETRDEHTTQAIRQDGHDTGKISDDKISAETIDKVLETVSSPSPLGVEHSTSVTFSLAENEIEATSIASLRFSEASPSPSPSQSLPTDGATTSSVLSEYAYSHEPKSTQKTAARLREDISEEARAIASTSADTTEQPSSGRSVECPPVEASQALEDDVRFIVILVLLAALSILGVSVIILVMKFRVKPASRRSLTLSMCSCLRRTRRAEITPPVNEVCRGKKSKKKAKNAAKMATSEAGTPGTDLASDEDCRAGEILDDTLAIHCVQDVVQDSDMPTWTLCEKQKVDTSQPDIQNSRM